MAVRALTDAVDALLVQVPADLPGPQALTDATALVTELERLRALVLTRLADVDTRQLHTLADAPSTGTWLAAQQSSLTRTELALARRLATFPAVAAAVDTGAVSVAVAARIAAALVKLRPHLDRPDGLIDGQPAEPTVQAVVVDGVLSLICQARGGISDDDPLLQALLTQLQSIADQPRPELDRLTDAFLLLAQHVEPGDLPPALAQLLDALLPNELERRAADAHEQRGFRMRLKDDGSGWLITRGDLDLDCGELLQTVLTAELTADPDNPDDTAAYGHARADGWQPGDPLPEDAPAPRTLDQRRHDALRNGLRRYLDSGIAGLRDKVAPHLAVTVPIGALHDQPGALPPVAASGARLPRSLVRTLVVRQQPSPASSSASATRSSRPATPNAPSSPTNDGPSASRPAAAAKAPAAAADPAAASSPTTPTPGTGCGTTSLTDTVLLCEQTHAQLHRGRTIRLKDGRRLGPHGWITDTAA